MSRTLNIERRRKRIRHYHARRRQRSAWRRAFSYWWSTALILVFVFLATTNTVIWFYPRATDTISNFALPEAKESIHYASREAIRAHLTRGTFQQTSKILSDDDIGISLDHPLPTLPPYTPKPLGALPTLKQAMPPLSALHIVPKAYRAEFTSKQKVVPALTTHLSPTLKLAHYTFTLPTPPDDFVGDATFLIESNAEGKVETVLRLAPTGAESEFLSRVRLALLGGLTQKAAQGTLRLQWRKGK